MMAIKVTISDRAYKAEKRQISMSPFSMLLNPINELSVLHDSTINLLFRGEKPCG
jgi:hypothetical protein